MCNSDVTRNISKSIFIDDIYETTIKMQTEYHDQVSFESTKENERMISYSKLWTNISKPDCFLHEKEMMKIL